MDVRLIFFIIFSLFLTACSQTQNIGEGESILRNNEGDCGPSVIKNQYIIKWKDGRTTIEKGMDEESLLKDIVEKKRDEIERVEYDHKIQLKPLPVQSLSVAFMDYNWGAEDSKADTAWTQNIYGQGVTVAVIDSGVDYTHSLLQNQIAVNQGEVPNNGVDDDGNGYVDDYYGYSFTPTNEDLRVGSKHGTHVAGIIGAEHSDSNISKNHMQGVAPQAQIIPIKFIDSSGFGSVSGALQAIDYAVARGAKIINASWGGGACSVELNNKIASLSQTGTLFIAASGNNGKNIDVSPDYPAAFINDNQITVGATTSFTGMAHFSNYGFNRVQLFAPGAGIVSTVPGDFYEPLDGTSMATPFVAGAAALLWGHRPQATAAQIKQAILNSATQDSRYFNSTQGRLNIQQAIAYLQQVLP